MSTYDDIRENDPVDMSAVAADGELVEQLRRALSPRDAVVWDDDDAELDPAFALLRALQLDVAADLPLDPILPVGVTRLTPRRFGRTATIAAITAGVLSIGGVAAAASAPGSTLGGVRSAVSAAVSTVVNAITPDSPVGPAVAAPPAKDEPSPKATPPGELVSAAARSASAATQITAELDQAGRFLTSGQYVAAKEQLDAAARKLPLVLDLETHDRLSVRLDGYRAQLDAPRPAATHGRSSNDPATPAGSTRHDSSGRSPSDTSRSTADSSSAGDTSGRTSPRVEATRSPAAARSLPTTTEPTTRGAGSGDIVRSGSSSAR